MPDGDGHDRAVAEAEAVRQRVAALARAGVEIHDPTHVWVEATVEVAPGATLWGGVVLRGSTRVFAGAEIQTGVVLVDTEVGERAVVKPYSVCVGASIGSDVAVGPMAHLREGARLEADVKVGNFVEVKKSTVGPRTKVGHLTYIGDADVGEDTNIGAGTITCNFDGVGKHRTVIGSRVFVGSNTALVAPVSVGDGAIVGAGSTITRDVPAEALAVERAEEKVRPGLAPRIRERNRQRAEGKGDG
jgi:bifunctional UDP-N-acetylglucosamine pyrophosphorylase/glucosamine-1-phosphate N-acetyltransferase